MPCRRKRFEGAEQIWVPSVPMGRLSMWVKHPRDHEEEAELALQIEKAWEVRMHEKRVRREKQLNKPAAAEKRSNKAAAPIKRTYKAAAPDLYFQCPKPISKERLERMGQRRLLSLKQGLRRSEKVENNRLKALNDIQKAREPEPEPEARTLKPSRKVRPFAPVGLTRNED